MPADGNVEMLQQVLDGFNKHDLDAIMAHFADDGREARSAGHAFPRVRWSVLTAVEVLVD